jgi:hypothetical protein
MTDIHTPRFRLGFLTHVQGRDGPAAIYRNAATTRIRLATAITILPLEDAPGLAEDISVVDTISGGRVEIGVTTEGLAVLTKALDGEEVGPAGFRIQPPPGDFSDRIWASRPTSTPTRRCAASTPSTATPTRSSRRCRTRRCYRWPQT